MNRNGLGGEALIEESEKQYLISGQDRVDSLSSSLLSHSKQHPSLPLSLTTTSSTSSTTTTTSSTSSLSRFVSLIRGVDPHARSPELAVGSIQEPSSASSFSSSSASSLDSIPPSHTSTLASHHPPTPRRQRLSPCARMVLFFFILLGAVIFTTLVFIIIITDNILYYALSQAAHYALRYIEMFFGLVQILLFFWLYGIVVHIFQRNRIDYGPIYNFPPNDPCAHLQPGYGSVAPHDHKRVFRLAASLTYVLAAGFVGMVIYSATTTFDDNFPTGLFPLVVFFCFLVFLVFPWIRPYPKTRLLFARLSFESFICIVWPFFGFEFAHLLFSDALTSASLTLWEIELMLCFIFSGDIASEGFRDSCSHGDFNFLYLQPIVYTLPFWIRLIQCFYCFYRDRHLGMVWERTAHLANAGKYFSSIVVVISSNLVSDLHSPAWSPIYSLWIIASIIKTVYSFLWDVIMDWDLFQFRRYPHEFPLGLRRRRLYAWTWSYYFAIISNFFLRASWTIALSVQTPPNWGMLMALLEIFRRSQWMIFRVEAQVLRKLPAHTYVHDVHSMLPSGEPNPAHPDFRSHYQKSTVPVLSAYVLKSSSESSDSDSEQDSPFPVSQLDRESNSFPRVNTNS